MSFTFTLRRKLFYVGNMAITGFPSKASTILIWTGVPGVEEIIILAAHARVRLFFLSSSWWWSN